MGKAKVEIDQARTGLRVAAQARRAIVDDAVMIVVASRS